MTYCLLYSHLLCLMNLPMPALCWIVPVLLNISPSPSLCNVPPLLSPLLSLAPLLSPSSASQACRLSAALQRVNLGLRLPEPLRRRTSSVDRVFTSVWLHTHPCATGTGAWRLDLHHIWTLIIFKMIYIAHISFTYSHSLTAWRQLPHLPAPSSVHDFTDVFSSRRLCFILVGAPGTSAT